MATPAAPKAAAPAKANVVQDAYQRILESIAPNAAVLKKNYNGYLGRGLLIAAIIHLAGVGAYWAYVKATEVAVVEDTVLEQVSYADITPPAITDTPPPPDAAPPPPAAAVATGTPTPVPDEQAPPERTIATQEEISTSGPAHVRHRRRRDRGHWPRHRRRPSAASADASAADASAAGPDASAAGPDAPAADERAARLFGGLAGPHRWHRASPAGHPVPGHGAARPHRGPRHRSLRRRR